MNFVFCEFCSCYTSIMPREENVCPDCGAKYVWGVGWINNNKRCYYKINRHKSLELIKEGYI